MNRFFKPRIIISVIALAVLVFGHTAFAAEFIYPKDKETDISIQPPQMHRNLYTAGMNVIISTDTLGDLYATGRSVIVGGKVEQDATLAGENIIVNSPIGSDLRTAGSTININAPISGDTLLAGNTVVLSENSSVGGDLFVAGNSVTLHAPVAGKVRLTGTKVVINSRITGDVFVRSHELVFGPKSDVAGLITYKGKKTAVVADGAQVSQIAFTKLESKQVHKTGFAKVATFGFIIKFLSMLLVAGLIMKLVPRIATSVVSSSFAKPLLNMGIGLVALIAFPIVIIVLFMTIIGWYVALILLAVYALSLLLACVLGAILTGSYLIKLFRKNDTMPLGLGSILLGVFAYNIFGIIPLVGHILLFIIFLISYGSFIRGIKTLIHKNHTSTDTGQQLIP